MKETLHKLWDEYLWEEGAKIDTDEERMLTRKAAELHETVDNLLNEEQRAAVEKYIEASADVEAFCVKKAFLRGCEFAVSFILEARQSEGHEG